MQLGSCIEKYKEGPRYNRAPGWEGGRDLQKVEVKRGKYLEVSPKRLIH